MIELLEHYFYVLIQCVGAIYFGLGIVLLFGKVPLLPNIFLIARRRDVWQ